MGAKGEGVMVCEYCGRQFTQLPENGICPGCGAVVEQKEKIRFPKPPIGVYKNKGRDRLEITEDTVRFHIERENTPVRERVIPYTRLYKVFFECGNRFSGGWIAVQAWEDRYDKIADTFWKVMRDKTTSTIIFDPKRAEDFAMVSDFLQQCAEIANAAREEN